MTAIVGLVRATTPPSMAVEVGHLTVRLHRPRTEEVHLKWPVPLSRDMTYRILWPQKHPRIDLVCVAVDAGDVTTEVFRGRPAANPEPPWCPDGWLPVALVLVRPGADEIHDCDITEVRP